jgi:hypothetical protein
MQQLFYMTTDGRLKEPRSGAEYDATAWPGRVVAVCPRRPGETDDEFGYLAIVELVAVSTAKPKEPNATTVPASLIARSDQPAAPSKRPAPLSVQRTSRLWFQCVHSQLRKQI